jgi:hypothetical protein
MAWFEEDRSTGHSIACAAEILEQIDGAGNCSYFEIWKESGEDEMVGSGGGNTVNEMNEILTR